MKICSVVGARPHFVKCAPLSRELRKRHTEILIHTGQHYDYEMSQLFFEQLDIPAPDYHLGVGSGLHGYQTGEMLKKLERVLLEEKPDLVIVFGDTNSTLAGALAAVKLHIAVGHVEAGPRTFDKSMPEEINRVLIDHCSDLLFCPTKKAVLYLKHEGISNGVYLTGDVMVDTLFASKGIIERSDVLARLGLAPKQYILATVHREANTEKESLTKIVDAFCEMNEQIVIPLHPRTEKALKQYRLYSRLAEHAMLIKPSGYPDFLSLMSYAKKIITDSGGAQKEAYILKVPCVTLMKTTGWPETVEDGWNVLVGTDVNSILKAMNDLNSMGKQRNIFGDGKASQKIVEIIDGLGKR